MKHTITLILLLLVVIQNSSAQDKVLKGNMPKWEQERIKELGLLDFSKDTLDFSFRFHNHGQYVEIFRHHGRIYGVLTNYIFNRINKHHETLSNKIQLDSVMALRAYEVIQQSGILSLPSSEEIKRWPIGADGITYGIEQANKSEYQYKHYWTPSGHDSIPECLLVSNLVNALSETLKLSEAYSKFEKRLPPRGCYSSGGGAQTCYMSRSYTLGYLGSGRLPLGFSASARTRYIGKTYIGLMFQVQGKFDTHDNYDLGLHVYKDINPLSSGHRIWYNYRIRKLGFVDSNRTIYNHQLLYQGSIKRDWTITSGAEYMFDGKKKIAGVLGLSKWFSKPSISINAIASIFEDDINYRIGIGKGIGVENISLISNVTVELFFEKFKTYHDLNICLRIGLDKWSD